MISKIIYPAVLSHEDNKITRIVFPDLKIEDTINSDSYAQAITKAEEMLKEHMLQYVETIFSTIPEASAIADLKTKNHECTVIISVNVEDIINQLDNSCIRKTLTLPFWLNEEAKKYNLNFSKILKQGLIRTLKNNDTIT